MASISVPFAGILIACTLDPSGKGTLLPTRPMNRPTGSAPTGQAPLFSESSAPAPAVCVESSPKIDPVPTGPKYRE
jgi:hypothetical protein